MPFGFFSMYRNPKTRPRYFFHVKTTPVIVKLDVVSGVDSGQYCNENAVLSLQLVSS